LNGRRITHMCRHSGVKAFKLVMLKGEIQLISTFHHCATSIRYNLNCMEISHVLNKHFRYLWLVFFGWVCCANDAAIYL